MATTRDDVARDLCIFHIGSSQGRDIGTNTAVAGRGHHIGTITEREKD